MKWIAILLLFSFLQRASAQDTADDSIVHRIVIIGDAGDPGAMRNGKAVVLDAIRRTIPLDSRTVVLFVGDNLYSNGLPCEGDVCYQEGVNALDTQASLVLGTKATAYFMPGNHDWANGKPEGYENILRQGALLNSLSDNIMFYPQDGCPGPTEVPLGKDVVLIIMDSQWWLVRGEKPGVESDCENKTEDQILDAIKDIIDDNQNKLILFACHHPFKSTGVHSGYFGIKQHIFPFTDLHKSLYIPLPGLGSIYPISRGVFGSPQDLRFPLYVNMVNQVGDVLKAHPYVVHIAGHEHNLQLISDSSYQYIVSGGGCKSQRVGHSKKTKYAAASMGFAVLDISKGKNVRATFYEVDPKKDEIKKAFSETILNFSKFPELAADTATRHDLEYKDSAIVIPNKKYAEASGFERLMLGNNYRKEWATPVKLKVLDINKIHGGLKPDRLGGGKQTRVLHMKDKNGDKWVLRSLNKDPQKAIPKNFRETFAGEIVQKMISANYPYGALIVPPLAGALGIVHSTPEYFVVPDDYSLGRYRTMFANTVCMLEKHDPTPGGSKSTFKIFNKLRDKDDHRVDQKTVLKARMLDFLIADYDRHQDQWGWGKIDTGEQKIYYPVPRDRDEAFFYSEGLVMDYATWQRLPFLKGFRYEIPRIRWGGFVARYFDKTYLNEIDEDQWRQTLNEFRSSVTDSVISASVKRLPPEIAKMDSAAIVGKLKSRRDLLPEKSIKYYRYISKRVNILGSNKDEYFHVSNSAGGVLVDVYSRHEHGDTDILMYSRKFDPKVTRELRLYGFNGDDMFRVDDDVKHGIELRIIGGQGSDTFDIRGRMRNTIYDFKKETNPILARRRTHNMMSKNPLVNNYNEKEENYTTWRFPHLEAGFNPEDLLMIGVGIMRKTHNFRKKPYATDQKVQSMFALANQAYQVRYSGEFREVVRTTDVVVNGQYVNPTLDNFFGFGNESVKDPNADIHFYRVRYTHLDGSILLRERFFRDKVSVGLGPAFYSYSWDRQYNSDRLISNPSRLGLDSNSIYNDKNYAGGKLSINVNNLNAELFPTRGIDWTTDLTAMRGLNSNSQPLTKFESNMAVYASLSEPAKVVAVLRLGGGRILSKKYEYFQALTLGANNYLRGFRKDRFSGSSVLYADVELRVKLLDVRSYIMPGTLGIVGFNDFGRVWVENERSAKWHDAYGAGLYYTPFNMVIISVTSAFSGEESLLNFTVGAKINLTF